MKKLISISVLIIIFITFKNSLPQAYDGAFYGLFFARQPSARAEGMGKSIASVPGDVSTLFFNPAGSASLKGLNIYASVADHYYDLDNAYYSFFGASYRFDRYITAAFSGDIFMMGEHTRTITNEFGEVAYEKYEPSVATGRLTASSELLKDFYVGININDLAPDELYKKLSVGNENGIDDNEIVYFDLGLMKSLIFNSSNMKHKLTLASSLTNLNFAGFTFLNGKGSVALPSIFRIGLSYDLTRKMGSDATLGLLLNLEYEDVFNSQYYGGYNAGMELSVFDLFFLRMGYYNQNLSNCPDCAENISEFTYGAGVNIPINKWGVIFDYANLKQPPLKTNNNDWENFEVFTMRLYFNL